MRCDRLLLLQARERFGTQRLGVATFLAFALSGAPVFAGSNQSATLQHPNCGQAVEVLGALGRVDVRDAPKGTQVSLALAAIGGCPAQAPETLARLWSLDPTDSTFVRLLMDATSRVRDRRLLDAILQVSDDPARPLIVRLAALGTLVGHYNPRFTGQLRVTPASRFPQVVLNRLSHPVETNSPEPIGEADRRRIVDLLARMAERDPSDEMRSAARYLARELTPAEK